MQIKVKEVALGIIAISALVIGLSTHLTSCTNGGLDPQGGVSLIPTSAAEMVQPQSSATKVFTPTATSTRVVPTSTPTEVSSPHIELVGEPFVIADSPRYTAFTDVERLANGDLVVVYYAGKDHVDPNSTIEMRTSMNNGLTWSEPTTVVPSINAGAGVRDPHIVQLVDGTLLLTAVFGGDYLNPQGRPRGSRLIRSVDNGETWGDPYQGELWEYQASGKICQLEDGTILAPLDKEGSTYVKKSVDNGLTFHDTVTVASSEHTYTEWEMARMAEGSLVGLTRTNDGERHAFRVVSTDNGKTWGTPKDIGFNIDAPGLLADGDILLMNHRDRSRAGCFISLSTDGGQSWETSVPLVAGLAQKSTGYVECGYGGLVKLPAGAPAEYFTTYYAPLPEEHDVYPPPSGVRVWGQFFNVAEPSETTPSPTASSTPAATSC